MADRSEIEWTDATWNPVTGCTKVSPGCKHCYAERFAERFRGVPDHPYEQGFDLRLRPDRLEQPQRWRKPRRIFVCSMADLFHEDVPWEFISDVFSAMVKAPHHTFQVLTKRADRLAELAPILYWPPWVWCGVSVESDEYASRVDGLLRTPANVRFVSAEPLLGPLPSLTNDLHFGRIDWLIVGGESGPGARPMHPDWARDLRDDCVFGKKRVPFFFKQWGGARPKSGGRLLDGKEWSEYPSMEER